MPVDACRLCSQVRPLQESHVLPAFAIRWLKQTSVGHFRTVEEPNKRIQDGPKEYWLCEVCEQLFSRWETRFAQVIFSELSEHGPGETRPAYGDWALKFACSVSWRVLQLVSQKGLEYLGPIDSARAAKASQVWKEFLLGARVHPGEFEQHLVHLDAPAEVSDTPSPHLARYMLRSFDLDVVTSPKFCFTYAKLGRVAIFGAIRFDRRSDWQGTRLHVRQGRVGAEPVALPYLIAKYWNDRADHVMRSVQSLSPQQNKKIENLLNSTDPNVLAQSEGFRAMQADVHLSGDRAFTRKTSTDSGSQ